MNQYDIYLADVPFEEVKETKVRPIVILEDKSFLVTCVPVTSNTSRPEDYVIVNWKEAGLRQPSAIRISKMIELDSCLIDRKIGHLHPIDILGLQSRLI